MGAPGRPGQSSGPEAHMRALGWPSLARAHSFSPWVSSRSPQEPGVPSPRAHTAQVLCCPPHRGFSSQTNSRKASPGWRLCPPAHPPPPVCSHPHPGSPSPLCSAPWPPACPLNAPGRLHCKALWPSVPPAWANLAHPLTAVRFGGREGPL